MVGKCIYNGPNKLELSKLCEFRIKCCIKLRKNGKLEQIVVERSASVHQQDQRISRVSASAGYVKHVLGVLEWFYIVAKKYHSLWVCLFLSTLVLRTHFPVFGMIPNSRVVS